MVDFPVVMPNLMSSVSMRQTHTLAIPIGCCPVSGEPRQASILTISYDASNGHLEVMQLAAFVASMKGGLKCPHSGNWAVRDLEHMIQFIVQRCANDLQKEVEFIAVLGVSFGEVKLEGVAKPTIKTNGQLL